MSNLDQSAAPVSRSEDSMMECYGLTKREHAAILLRVPESGDHDIDAMIRTAQRRDLAAMEMAGILASPVAHEMRGYDNVAREAMLGADRLLSALSHPVAEKEPT